MLDIRKWLSTVASCAAFALTACGGGGDSSGSAGVRIVNATLTHASIDLLANGSSAVAATPIDNVSGYAGVASGSPALQVNDSASGSALATLAPSVAKDSHYVVVAYESGGVLRTTVVAEDVAAPVAGSVSLRVFDAAVDAGAIDVYVTDPATAGGTGIAANVIAPSVGGYVLVPAGGAINVSVNGASVGAPATAPAAGSDSTLLVFGSAAAPTASLIADDNHLPTSSGNLKLRLLNGLTGAASPLTLDAAFVVIASNVVPGTASPYAVVASSTALRVDVFSPASLTPIYSDPGLSVPGNAVYTLFMLGDAAAPIPLLRRDR